MIIPPVQLKDSNRINPNQYSICIKGEEVAKIKDGKDKNESQLPTLMEKKEI